MTLNITRCLFLVEKQGISILRCLLPRNWLLCQQAVITAMLPSHTTMYVPSLLRLKEVQMGPMILNITRWLCFCLKTREYQYFDVCCPETSSCASKPLLLRCNLVIPQCMCQVSLRLKEVQMGTHDFKYNKVPLFARKPWNINTSMSAATILALVPASRYYCDVT